jgi:hypothetical protein
MNSKGRLSYKIFVGTQELELYLGNNKDKICESMIPVFSVGEYKEYAGTEVRKVTRDEIVRYLAER